MWLFWRALKYAALSRRGRRLLFLGLLSLIRLARDPRARLAYERAWAIAASPRPRAAAGRVARSTVARVKR